ncbi:MAG: PIN domain-containing protein [Sulfurisoma sp.]|nr:PIN domain-containing protein [Sulfurisoma sp.]
MQSVKPCYVLDACALLRVAQSERGMEKVRDFLYAAARGECEMLMHQINLGEVVYRIAKVYGWDVAERKRHEIGMLPIDIVPFDEPLFWDAVRIKGEHPLSYADAFAAALAIARGATLLTTDPEFESLGTRVPRLAI